MVTVSTWATVRFGLVLGLESGLGLSQEWWEPLLCILVCAFFAFYTFPHSVTWMD